MTNGERVELDDDIASRWGPRVVDHLAIIVEEVQALAEGGDRGLTLEPDGEPTHLEGRVGLGTPGCGGAGGCAVLGIAVGAVDLPVGSVVAELLDKVPGVDIESGLSERQAAILWRVGSAS